ncbi:uncharacterized protein GJ701_016468 isoform 2-T2 [Geothlypis trichas]
MVLHNTGNSSRQAGAAVAGSRQGLSQVERAALLQRGDHWIPAEHHSQERRGQQRAGDRAAAPRWLHHRAPAAGAQPWQQLRRDAPGADGCWSRGCADEGLSQQQQLRRLAPPDHQLPRRPRHRPLARHGRAPAEPIARGSEAAREHQLIVAATHNASLIESICSGQARLSNASAYLAALLNLSAATDFVLGDGSRGHGLHNAALSPGRDYMALLRLVRLEPQAEKFTCVCYSFSLGQTVGQWHWIVIGLVLLLAVILVAAVILWVVHSRKRKYMPNKTKEDNEEGKSG